MEEGRIVQPTHGEKGGPKNVISGARANEKWLLKFFSLSAKFLRHAKQGMAVVCSTYFQNILRGEDIYSEEEDDCFSDEEYSTYLTEEQHTKATYRPRFIGKDGSLLLAECDPCLLTQLVLQAKAINSFLRLNRYWHAWVS